MTGELSQITEHSARSGFFLFSGSTLSLIIMAISSILIGRLLGPELYGQYNLIVVVPQLLLLFTDLGITSGITKFTASLSTQGKSDVVPQIIRYGLFFRLGVGLFISLLCLIFPTYFALIINRPDLSFYVQIASVSLVFQVAFFTANAAFVGLDKSEYSALATNVQALVKTILQISLVVIGFNVGGAITGYVGGFVAAAIVGCSILFYKFLRPSKMHKKSHLASSPQILKILAQYGLPLYVSVMLVGLMPLFQQVILSFFTSDAQIGNFRAAYNFVQLLAVIPLSITTALLPAFSKLELLTTDRMNTFFKRANKYTCLLIVPSTTIVILFSKQIVEFVYGPVYDSAALFLSIYVIIYFLVIIGYLTLTSLFNGLGKTRITLKITLVQFIFFLFFSIFLGYAYGVVGAIVGFLVSGFVSSIYGAYIAIREFHVDFTLRKSFKIYFVSLLSSIIPLFLLFFTNLSYLIILIVGITIYFFVFITLLPLLKVIKDLELVSLFQLTSKIPVLCYVAKPLILYQQKIINLSRKILSKR